MSELDQAMTEEENLFADYEAEETPEAEETAEEAETQPEETAEPAPFLRVKYMGEEQELSEEDARTLAQKGMNYDNIYSPLEKLAKANGLTVGEYINRLNDTQFAYEVSGEVDRMRQDPKYKDVSEDILQEIASAHISDSMNRQVMEVEKQQDAQDEALKKQIDVFMNEYPEYRNKGPEALDPKVFEYVKQGYTLLEAYEKFRRSDSAARLNEANRKRSLGNTSNAGKTETDDFLSGFLEG